jgi:hypothetical protein
MPDPVFFSVLIGLSIALLLCAAIGYRRGQFVPGGDLKRTERPVMFWGSIAWQVATGIAGLAFAICKLFT